MSQPFQIKVSDFAWSKEYKRLEKAFENLQKESRKDALEILTSQARLFCIDLIFVTTPYGKSKKSQMKGKGAVAKDINKIYVTESDLYDLVNFKSEEQAKAFYGFMKRGTETDLKRAKGILLSLEISMPISDFDGGRTHRASRNNRGRVSTAGKKIYTNDVKDLKRYVKEVQDRVGLAKAGWAAGAADLSPNNRGIPAWVRKHNRTNRLGSAKVRKRGAIDEILIINNVRYITKLVGKGQIIQALGKRARAIERLVKKVEEINQRQFNNKVK